MTKRPRITARAKEILASVPDGLRLGELRGRLRESFPDVPEGTINRSTGNLHDRFPDEVYKPAWGRLRLTKFREQESSPHTGNAGNEEQAKIAQKQRSKLAKILFDAIPKDGSRLSNGAALQKVQEAAKARLNLDVSREMYFEIRKELIADGRLGKGAGYGGSVYRIEGTKIAAETATQRKKTSVPESAPHKGSTGNEEQAKTGEKQRSQLAKILFDATPKDGKTISNGAALQKVQKAAKARLKLDVSKETYFEIRNELIGDGRLGKGLGYGGSVYRIEAEASVGKTGKQKNKVRERDLYEPVRQYIEQTWVDDEDIKRFVVDKTADLGRKKTYGVWTRPDLSLVAIHTFTYIPGKTIELVTFEVKPADDFRIEGVFETAAHSKAAHRSYLMIYTPNGKPDTPKFKRLESECKRFRLGLILFDKPDDWKTYETVLEAERRNPNPADVNAFIKDVMYKQHERISEMLR